MSMINAWRIDYVDLLESGNWTPISMTRRGHTILSLKHYFKFFHLLSPDILVKCNNRDGTINC
jgi:hypothetical protein